MGSTVDMRKRWARHKSDIRHDNWTASGIARHFGQCHRADRELYIGKLEVTLLDSCREEKDLKKLEDK